MNLKLRFPPSPEHAKQHAELVVEIAREVSQAHLDFSPASLAEVDRIVEGFRADRVPI
jgi:hypothetical protein